MRPDFKVILDDRELPPPDLRGLIGSVKFGDLLRRRKRYLDELHKIAVFADDICILQSEDEVDALKRNLEASHDHSVWLRLPTTLAPSDMGVLGNLLQKTAFALDAVQLSPLYEDDAVLACGPKAMLALISAPDPSERRKLIHDLLQSTVAIKHDVEFLDLRQPGALGLFLSGATEPRGFNSLTVKDGVFTKSSGDISKLRAEHDFFALAPPKMQRFLLPAFELKEDGSSASYKMEHLRIPDAALQFVLGALNETQLDQLISQFFAFVQSRPTRPVDRSKASETGKVQIIDKMHSRLATLLETDAGQRLDQLLAAGGTPDGLQGLSDRATPMVQTALAANKSDTLAFSHGDPCFSNILFDHRTGLMRMIDPKGATTFEEGLLHPLYDVAKFSHSVLGGYDYVNNDLFSVEVAADLTLKLSLHHGGPAVWAKELFKARLEQAGWDFRQVRAIEASLFLSMLPLHLDHPRKLVSFALIAKGIIEELESNA